jgi:beta-galactosidase
MYESDDLYNWRYEGVILPCSDDPSSELYAPMRFERPKIIYNDKTKQYVLWCHYVRYPGKHGFEAGQGEAGIAVCDTVNGTYRWVGAMRPIDQHGIVRDCTLYKDKDGSAYFIYDRDISSSFKEHNRCLYIVKLTDDYLSCTSEYKRLDVAFQREAPAITYHDGYYYMVTSGLTGWHYNQAKYFRSRELLGEWEDMGDPCVEDTEQTTFCTQTTAIFQVEGRRDCYIHMAERHNYMHSFLHCSYVWLPIHFGEDHTMSIAYQKEWKLSPNAY